MTVSTEHLGLSLPFARACRDVVRESDIVHIHAIWNFPTWCAMREAHRAGVPYVVAPQGSLEDWALNRNRRLKAAYGRNVERPYFDRAFAMQALTRAEVEQCRRFGIKAPAIILPNGVDLDAVDCRPQHRDLHLEFSLPSDAVVFLFLGRLFPKKGLDLLIPAFSRLVQRGANACLLIAGHDAGSGYSRHVEHLVNAAGASHRIRFLGEVAGKEKYDILRSADAFVLSSYSEGLPVAVLEAMACGRPVIVTRSCNLPEVEEWNSGWSVEPRVDSVFEGLKDAFSSRHERDSRGRNARRLVAHRFTWRQIADQSTRLYSRRSVHEQLAAFPTRT